MKLKKVLSIVLAVMLMMSCMSFTAFADGNVCKIVETGTEYATVQEAITAAGTGQTVQMIADSTENVTVESDDSITLDLNGHVLNGGGNGAVITTAGTLTIKDSDQTTVHNFKVGADGLWTLTNEAKTVDFEDLTARPATDAVVALKGGCITGGSGSAGGIWTKDDQTLLTIESGSIVGNRAASNGGGIYCGGLNDKVYINGGSIVGNYASGWGGGLKISTACYMTGGVISYNTAGSKGGGVFNSSDLYAGGTAKITGNTLTDGTTNNTQTISGIAHYNWLENSALTGDASIGVTRYYGGAGQFSQATRFSKAEEAYFFSDDPAYADKYNETGGYMELVTGYTVTVGSCEHGSVSVGNQQSAYDGEEVTITATPEACYQLASLTATYNDGTQDQDLEITDGKFTMPAYAVTVNASFSEVPTTKAFGDNFDLDLETSTENIPENTTVDQYYMKTTGESTVYNHRIGVSWSSEVMNIKVADAKKWHPATLSWEVDTDKNGEATVDGETNKKTITLTNYSAKAFTCNLTFAADDSVAGKYTSYSVSGTDVNLAAVMNDITNPGTSLHTGDLPSASITATITPTLTGEGSFHGAAVTTEAQKYGTFTITCTVVNE